jgi:hypothetical protein
MVQAPVRVLILWMVAAGCALAQEQTVPVTLPGGPQAEGGASSPAAIQPVDPPGGKRVFGVLPNYRTADSSLKGTVLKPGQKLTIAAKDSFDYPLVALAGGLAGLGQWIDQDPDFGQGLKGYGHRLITNYADQSMGNMFTEGVFPVLLHEDPRYFRRATGPKLRRVGYALTRVIVTHKDSGGERFNYSEWMGNACATAISNAYYAENRNVLGNVEKLLEEVGTDAGSQVLKEFWPDIKRKWFTKSSGPQS